MPSITAQLAQALISLLGFMGVIYAIRQKTRTDNRAEWWKRYVWAKELSFDERPDKQETGLQHLDILRTTPLITSTEKFIVEYTINDDVEDAMQQPQQTQSEYKHKNAIIENRKELQ